MKPDRADFPWWLLILTAIGATLFWRVLSDGLYSRVLMTLVKGVEITLFVTLVGFFMASVLGLLLALGGRSRCAVLRQAVRFYVEVVRGVRPVAQP